MPTISGEEFLQLIRTNDELKQIKVIIYSSRESLATVAENIDADGFIPKGKDFALLVEKVGSYLDR